VGAGVGVGSGVGVGVAVGCGVGVAVGLEIAVDAGEEVAVGVAAEVAVAAGVEVAVDAGEEVVGVGLAGAVGTGVDVVGVPEAAVGVDGARGCSQVRVAAFQAWPPWRQATRSSWSWSASEVTPAPQLASRPATTRRARTDRISKDHQGSDIWAMVPRRRIDRDTACARSSRVLRNVDGPLESRRRALTGLCFRNEA